MAGVGLVLVLGVVRVIALTGVFYPWAFYLGGKFHIIPYWQGVGKAHAKSGDYLLWVQFEPTTSGSRIHQASNLTGLAYVCTPRGARFRMHLGGGMRKNLNLSTDDESISLHMNYWPGYGTLIGDHRPGLEFRGKCRSQTSLWTTMAVLAAPASRTAPSTVDGEAAVLIWTKWSRSHSCWDRRV